MTLKQEAFFKKLPENNLNIRKTMRDVGYSEQTSRSGAQYALLRKKMQQAYDPEVIKGKIVKAEKLFLKAADHSNHARMLELQAKIAGLTKDTNVQGVAVNINGVIDTLKGSGQPVEKVVDSNILHDNNIEQPKFT